MNFNFQSFYKEDIFMNRIEHYHDWLRDAHANAVFWHNKTKTKAINAEKTKCRDSL